VSRTYNAAVGRDTAQHKNLHAEVPKQSFQWTLIKGRMHRFQNEIVFGVGTDLRHEWAAWSGGAKTILKQLARVGPPLAKIIVYVNDRKFRFSGADFQTSDTWRDKQRLCKQPRTIREFEVIDDVNDKKGSFHVCSTIVFRYRHFSCQIFDEHGPTTMWNAFSIWTGLAASPNEGQLNYPNISFSSWGTISSS
jgi:hypothetical protein